jgi:D-serine deaminase-like pyridoxal phosphate-dependent protein
LSRDIKHVILTKDEAMKPDHADIGLSYRELETPALIANLRVVESNSMTMRSFLSPHKIHLRPHAKIHHATPQIARMQMKDGTIGITCAKLNEAETLREAGIQDILIANQIVGKRKIDRLVNLAGKCDLKVAVDSRENAQAIAKEAVQRGVRVGVLVEVNIGHNRCGVAPFEPTLDMVNFILHLPGLVFKGLMGYDGHCTLKVSPEERGDLSRKAYRLLADTRSHIEKHGIEVSIVSGGGTFTYRYAAEIEGITEIQAGTYLLMDTTFQDHGVREFDCALSVLTTVISQPGYAGAEKLAIVDTGKKSISTALGLPEVLEPDGAKVISLSDEHGRISFADSASALRLGDQVEFSVPDANGTINQFDRIYAVRDGLVEDVWFIPKSGNHT